MKTVGLSFKSHVKKFELALYENTHITMRRLVIRDVGNRVSSFLRGIRCLVLRRESSGTFGLLKKNCRIIL